MSPPPHSRSGDQGLDSMNQFATKRARKIKVHNVAACSKVCFPQPSFQLILGAGAAVALVTTALAVALLMRGGAGPPAPPGN